MKLVRLTYEGPDVFFFPHEIGWNLLLGSELLTPTPQSGMVAVLP